MNADGSIVTQGDANTTDDPWAVQPREIIGGFCRIRAVAWLLAWLGYWFVYLKSMAGLASLICALVGTGFLWSTVRELDDKPGEDSDCREGLDDGDRPVVEHANAAQLSLV